MKKKTKVVRKRATKNVPAVQAAPVSVREGMTPQSALKAFDMLGITSKLDPQQKLLFVEIAVMNNLNPLKREIHAVERNQKVVTNVPGKGEVTTYVKVLTPVTGYEVFIDRAEESGRLQYWFCKSEGSVKEGNLRATVTIKRRDWPVEFTWTCRYDEVNAGSPIWDKEPTHMTEKVTISRGFRLCFRDVLRGMPFTVEEEESRVERDVTPTLIEPKAIEVEKPAQSEQGREEVEAILLLRSELSQVFKKLGASKLYSEAEIQGLKTDGTEAKDDLDAMKKLLTKWQLDLAARVEKKEKAS